MKRFGRIMFCFLPALLAFGVQQLVSIPITGLAFLAALYQDTVESIEDVILIFYDYLTSGTFAVWVSAIYGVAALAVFAFWYYKKFRSCETRSVIKNFNIPIILGIILAVIGLQYTTNYVVAVTASIHPAWLDQYNTLIETVGFEDISIVLALYSVLIAPICEELIFRGVTLQYGRKAMPFWAANIFQALLFGIYHMNVIQGVYAFFIGIFLGYICEKGGSIYPAMLFHALFNMWGTFSPDWFMYRADEPLFFLLWLVVGIALLVSGLLLSNYGYRKRNSKVNIFTASSDM